MPSRPIAEYYGHLGPTGGNNLDSSWHGKTPLDSSVQNAIVTIEMKTSTSGAHVLKGKGSIRHNGDGLIPSTINQVIAVHPFTKRSGGGGGAATPEPGWED